MKVVRTALVAGVAFWGMGAAAPASAQFFLQPYNFQGKPVQGDEPGIGQPLPARPRPSCGRACCGTCAPR